MKYLKSLTTVFLLICVINIFGCQRVPERPNDLPELMPCTIFVTFGGKKLAEVGIQLVPKNAINDSAKRWAAGGKTDAEGKSALKTAFYYSGVAEGEYYILFTKFEPSQTNKNGVLLPAKNLIPAKYSQTKTAQIVAITKHQSEYTFELEGL
ncbi:MAG: hypothetical protein LBJ67_10310 [Planctomycetaceae bacterium]|jgi:hypothetical protein|nr:hypothetical protein [Planctomycetaceae bacterium]